MESGHVRYDSRQFWFADLRVFAFPWPYFVGNVYLL